MDTTTTTPPITVVRTREALRDAVSAIRADGRGVGFVPTMGAFHDGHLSLMRIAGQDDHAVVVSLFVNPTQFAPTEDLSKYPRDEARDVAMAASAGAELVFAPTVDQIYPDGFGTTVSVDGPTRILEGATRPTHFNGVATVVAKLLNMVRPDRAVFGQKDAQQVAVVKRMMRDLDLDDIELIIGPIVRESDGLAMSSRNVYLSDAERQAALVLRRSLDAAQAAVDGGERDPRAVEAVALATLAAEPLATPDYATLVHPDAFVVLDRLTEPALLCVAATVGPARLIDNTHITVN